MEQEKPQIVYDGQYYFRIIDGRRHWLVQPPNGYELTDGTIIRNKERFIPEKESLNLLKIDKSNLH